MLPNSKSFKKVFFFNLYEFFFKKKNNNNNNNNNNIKENFNLNFKNYIYNMYNYKYII